MDGDINLSRESPAMMNFVIDLHLYINEGGSDIYGEGLWKVSAWLAGDPHDERRAYGFFDQVCKIRFHENLMLFLKTDLCPTLSNITANDAKFGRKVSI